jgi:hypothetical protein
MTCDEQRLLTNFALSCACNEANSSSRNLNAETKLDLRHATSRHLAIIAMLKCVAMSAACHQPFLHITVA